MCFVLRVFQRLWTDCTISLTASMDAEEMISVANNSEEAGSPLLTRTSKCDGDIYDRFSSVAIVSRWNTSLVNAIGVFRTNLISAVLAWIGVGC